MWCKQLAAACILERPAFPRFRYQACHTLQSLQFWNHAAYRLTSIDRFDSSCGVCQKPAMQLLVVFEASERRPSFCTSQKSKLSTPAITSEELLGLPFLPAVNRITEMKRNHTHNIMVQSWSGVWRTALSTSSAPHISTWLTNKPGSHH